jgi:hypothetical protein
MIKGTLYKSYSIDYVSDIGRVYRFDNHYMFSLGHYYTRSHGYATPNYILIAVFKNYGFTVYDVEVAATGVITFSCSADVSESIPFRILLTHALIHFTRQVRSPFSWMLCDFLGVYEANYGLGRKILPRVWYCFSSDTDVFYQYKALREYFIRFVVKTHQLNYTNYEYLCILPHQVGIVGVCKNIMKLSNNIRVVEVNYPTCKSAWVRGK